MTTMAGMMSFDGPRPVAGEWDYRDDRVVMTARGESAWIATGEPAPSVRADAGLVMTWDGRIDNAADLAIDLGTVRSQPDRELALDAFERWGAAGLERLVGEWSLAIWDRRHRTLYLARDYMGARPLYYCAEDDEVGWSSDLAELVARCGRRDALSDAFAAHFMSVHPLPALTPYAGVRAVPAGCCLTFGATGAIGSRPIWTLRASRVEHRDPRAYEEELRRLWREAVAARLRTPGAVWAELSGGLDSSSVACMADRLIRARNVPARSLGLVSHVTLRSPEGDERRFIAEVEGQVGVRSAIVGVEDNQTLDDPARGWVSPYALQGVGLAMVHHVRKAGGRVVLSGRMGDAIMGCQPDNSEAVWDDLAHLHLSAALRHLRAWSLATRKPFVELAWRLFVPSPPAPVTDDVLLAPRLREQLRDAPRLDDGRGVRRSRRSLARQVLDYARGARLDIPLQPSDVVYTYPFSHRPLVEFVLAIPGEQLSAPGLTRSLMRRAFKGLLPPRVCARTSKGYYPPAAFRDARRQAAILDVNALEVVQRNWIDPDRLRTALRALTDGGGASGADVYRVLRLERWLQARRATSANPQGKEVNSHAVLKA